MDCFSSQAKSVNQGSGDGGGDLKSFSQRDSGVFPTLEAELSRGLRAAA